MARTYLYGIIEATDRAHLGITGIDGASPVYVVKGDGLGCVASDYIAEDLGSLPKEELVRRLLAHQRVVEHVMQQRTVLPVKFGTVLAEPQEVHNLLSQGRSQFIAALASIAEVVEMEVAATWDVGRVLHDVSNEDEVVRTREAIARVGQPSVEDRVRLGQVVKACMDRRRDSYRERMVSFLKPLCVDVAPNALVSDEMVMNVAFLLERARQREFDAAVEQLDKLFQDEIAFRVIGPLPPYSFSTVEIKRLNGREVEEARQTLGLTETLSGDAVRRAYRRTAAVAQGSLAPGEEGTAAHFARLQRAFQLLLSYCADPPGVRLSPPFRDRWVITTGRRREAEVAPSRYGVGGLPQ